MSEEKKTIEDVVINGTTYPPLADGKYDCVIMGTGLKEAMLSGLLSTNGYKVLHVDRNKYYGGESASLNLENLFNHFRGSLPDAGVLESLGKNRDYNVDLVPKLIMACGKLVKILLHTKITYYLEFKSIAGSYVWKGSKKEIFKVPSSAGEATKTPLMGVFQKRKFIQFLRYLSEVETGFNDADPRLVKCAELDNITMQQLYDKYGLDENTQDFVGHAMALRTSDAYKNEPATETVRAIQMYAYSLDRYGVSPYLYPKWGLGGLPESFARLCAVHGGTFMLETDVDEVLLNKDGTVAGVKSGDEAASAKFVVGDPSYFTPELSKVTHQVVRSILLMDHPPNCFVKSGGGGMFSFLSESEYNLESGQIIIPAAQVEISGYAKRSNDIYVISLSSDNLVVSKGQWVIIISTVVETTDPMSEIKCALDMVGGYLERFDYVSDYKEPVSDGVDSQMFISSSYDATSHFETTSNDVLDMFERITGKPLDMSINADSVSDM